MNSTPLDKELKTTNVLGEENLGGAGVRKGKGKICLYFNYKYIFKKMFLKPCSVIKHCTSLIQTGSYEILTGLEVTG